MHCDYATEKPIVAILPGSLFAEPPGVGSVSYTHLRAHETVLDLVCRLLLEKKKTKELLTQT